VAVFDDGMDTVGPQRGIGPYEHLRCDTAGHGRPSRPLNRNTSWLQSN
jgi:hypothetical protein